MSTAPTERIPPTYASQTTPDPSAGDQAKEQAQEAAGQAKERPDAPPRSTSARPRPASASAVRVRRAQRRRAAARAGQGPAGEARGAGRRPRRAARRLPEDSDSDRILGDVEDFGRRQPWAVIAVASSLGLRRLALPEGFLEQPLRAARAGRAQLPARTSDSSPRAGDVARASRRPADHVRATPRMAAADAPTTRRPRAPDRRAGQGTLASRRRRLSARRSSSRWAELQPEGQAGGQGRRHAGPAPSIAGLLALGALTAALIALLSTAMATWVAALIVMALWAVVAPVLAKAGQTRSSAPPRRYPDRRNREGGHRVGEEPDRSVRR